MNQLRQSRPTLARSWIVALGAACVAGCAVNSPPVLTSSVGSAPSTISQIHLVEPDAEQVQRGALYSAIAQELRDRGVAISEDATSVADFAISISPSSVGLYASEAGKSDEEPAALATTRERKWYDACEAVRVQATLVLYNRADGALRKSSKAESMGCEGADLPLAELATLLADDLLAD